MVTVTRPSVRLRWLLGRDWMAADSSKKNLIDREARIEQLEFRLELRRWFSCHTGKANSQAKRRRRRDWIEFNLVVRPQGVACLLASVGEAHGIVVMPSFPMPGSCPLTHQRKLRVDAYAQLIKAKELRRASEGSSWYPDE